MKIITGLSGRSAEGDHRETRGVLTAVHDEPARGVLRQVALGANGLVFRRAGLRAAIPLAELWKLAEAHEPGFRANPE